MKTKILYLLILFALQMHSQQKTSKFKKLANTQKAIFLPQCSPFATLSTGNNYSINAVCVSPNGLEILSSGDDGTIRLWDINSKTQTNSIVGVKNNKGAIWPVTEVAFSPNGKTFISAQRDSYPKLWDTTTAKMIKRIGQKAAGVYSLAISPNGILIATGAYGTIMIFDSNTNKEFSIEAAKNAAIISLKFSPDNKTLLAVSENQEITLWDASNGSKIQIFDIHNYLKDVEFATAAAFTPDGNTIISSGFNKDPYQGIIKIWNANDGTLRRTIIDGQSADCLAISHDGSKFAAGNFDHSVKIWDVASGKLLKQFVGNKGFVQAIAFSPDDQILVSGSNGGTINLWKVN